jgi:hypothetical protein
MPRGHHVIRARLQGAHPPQCADDAPTDLPDHRCNVGIAGRLGVDKLRLEALVGGKTRLIFLYSHRHRRSPSLRIIGCRERACPELPQMNIATESPLEV